MADEELPIPIEVPWKLVSTMKALTANGPKPAEDIYPPGSSPLPDPQAQINKREKEIEAVRILRERDPPRSKWDPRAN
jgi:hypothetical protein